MVFYRQGVQTSKGFKYEIEESNSFAFQAEVKADADFKVKHYQDDIGRVAVNSRGGGFGQIDGFGTATLAPDTGNTVKGPDVLAVHTIPDDGYVQERFRLNNDPAGSFEALTWTGSDYWVASANNVYNYDSSGNVLNSFARPDVQKNSLAGIGFDAENLWVAGQGSGLTGSMYKFSTSGSVLKNFDLVSTSPTGVTWDGTYLWVSDSTNGYVYRYTTEGSNTKRINMSEPGSAGLTWDGEYLWNFYQASDIMSAYDPKSGAQVHTFDLTAEMPSDDGVGLTWDGMYLSTLADTGGIVYEIASGTSLTFSYEMAGLSIGALTLNPTETIQLTDSFSRVADYFRTYSDKIILNDNIPSIVHTGDTRIVDFQQKRKDVSGFKYDIDLTKGMFGMSAHSSEPVWMRQYASPAAFEVVDQEHTDEWNVVGVPAAENSPGSNTLRKTGGSFSATRRTDGTIVDSYDTPQEGATKYLIDDVESGSSTLNWESDADISVDSNSNFRGTDSLAFTTSSSTVQTVERPFVKTISGRGVTAQMWFHADTIQSSGEFGFRVKNPQGYQIAGIRFEDSNQYVFDDSTDEILAYNWFGNDDLRTRINMDFEEETYDISFNNIFADDFQTLANQSFANSSSKAYSLEVFHSSDGSSRTFYFDDYTTGETGTITDSVGGPISATWDGNYYWVSVETDNNDDTFPQHVYKTDEEFNWIRGEGFDHSLDRATGITWDGQYLWMAAEDPNLMYQVTDKGEAVRQLQRPTNPKPTFTGSYIFTTEGGANSLYKTKTDSTNVAKAKIYRQDGTTAIGSTQRDIAWDGKYLMVADDTLNGIYYFDTDLSSGKAVTLETVYLNDFMSSTEGITWDGKHTVVTDNDTNSIYKLGNTNNFNISYNFQSYGPTGEQVLK